MCNHIFKPLWYVCDDDYGITTNKVYLETKCSDNNKGHLAYCTKCGQVFVREIAEKIPFVKPERKNGKWIQDGHHIQCNQCGISICDKDREGDVFPKNFCPNCGTDMR